MLAAQLHALIRKLGFGGDELRLRVERVAFEFGVAHLDQHSVLFDGVAGLDVALFDAAVDGRGNPANLFGHERAHAMHIADHLAAFDLPGHDCAALDAGRGWLEFRQGHRRAADDGKSQYQIKDAANALVAFYFFTALYVHNPLRP